MPAPAELSDLFSKATGDVETLDERDRKLLLIWEKEVRDKIFESAPGPISEPYRWHLPSERRSITHRFEIPDPEVPPFKGYITMGFYPSGQLGELFLEIAKEGAFVSGIMDALVTCVSIALQHGIPLSTFLDKFRHTKFVPAGMVTGAPRAIQGFAGSILDYLAKYLDHRVPDGVLSENLLTGTGPVR
jgi:ribonucleoside-diphosphate reductase alpha chain